MTNAAGLTGGCLCGTVRYRIDAAPVEALYCPCRMCRRAHGAPVVAWSTVPRAGFAISAGSPAAYRSSPQAFHSFCGRCGTPLSWEAAANPALCDVAIATLDNPAAVRPPCICGPEAALPGLAPPTVCRAGRPTNDSTAAP